MAFQFTDKFDSITSHGLTLKITEKESGDDTILPFYYYDIIDSNHQTVGKISIRIGHNFHSYYNGHIGYEIDEEYRGNRHAYNACQMVLDVAKFHGMDFIYLTCDESNVASYRTIERLGAQLMEICDVPENFFAWYESMEQKRIYKLSLL